MTRLLRYASLCISAILLIVVAGCGDILEVDNPNTLIEGDLNNPSASTAMANGAEASLTRGLGAMHAPYHTATDELTWIGSRDAWGQLDQGALSDRINEFTDAAFPYLAEARWQADDFISRVEAFRSEGDLQDDTDLARLYLYGAITYTSIADMFENYPIGSNRQEGAPPVGPENMAGLYDTALTYIENALSLTDSGTSLHTTLLGMKARALYSRAVWPKVNPAGQVDTANPLVNDQAAVTAAQEALDAMSEGFEYELELISSSPGLVVGDLSMALQVNSRAELGFGTEYIQPNPDGTYNPDDETSAVTFTDMITGEVHPYIKTTIDNFVAEGQFADITIVTAREMHAILAEAALAGNTSLDFAEQINAIRSVHSIAPYDGQGDAAFERDLLEQTRQVNLFLQGRRLVDHYRFEEESPEWTGARDPAGTFFPITITEVRANPNISQ